jgi:hypothetical protein
MALYNIRHDATKQREHAAIAIALLILALNKSEPERRTVQEKAR